MSHLPTLPASSNPPPGDLPGPGLASAPVFVLGSPRSATSLAALLLNHLGWHGYEEGHLFELLAALQADVERHEGDLRLTAPNNAWAVSEFPFLALKAGMLRLFEQFMVQRFGERWADKTPGPAAVRAAPALLSYFPRARFIFCKRRGIDVIESARRRFGRDGGTVRAICDQWVETMMQWRRLGPRLGRVALEIDHRDLVERPEEIAHQLAAFLGEPARAAEIRDLLARCKPEQTQAESVSLRLSEADWPEDEKAYVYERSAHCMSLFGYGFEDPGIVAAPQRPITYTVDPRAVDLSALADPSYFVPTGWNRFLLHPNELHGKPSAVRFRAVDLAGARFIGCRLEHGHPEGAAVCGRMELWQGDLLLAETAGSCSFGADCELALAVPPGLATADLVLRTEMADAARTNYFAWANIVGLAVSG